jgi:hypothetical protein
VKKLFIFISINYCIEAELNIFPHNEIMKASSTIWNLGKEKHEMSGHVNDIRVQSSSVCYRVI